MEKKAIKKLIDQKFNNSFKEYIEHIADRYNIALYERTMKLNIRDMYNWKIVCSSTQFDIPEMKNYICKYDQEFMPPKQGVVTFYIDMIKDEDFSKIYYFYADGIHKIAVEFKNGEIEEEIEELYF